MTAIAKMTRAEILAALAVESDDCPAAAILVGELLCGWHASAGDYDVFVFTEYFRGDRLVGWQEQFLLTAPHVCQLGTRSSNSLYKIQAVSFLPENPFNNEVCAALRERFGAY